MAGLRQLLKKEDNLDEQALKAAKVLEKNWPIVAEILGGSAATKTEDAISPGTITFFFHDGKWRFSANVKSEKKTILGDVADITKPWESVNYAVSEGECRQKDYTGQRNGQTEIPADVKVY